MSRQTIASTGLAATAPKFWTRWISSDQLLGFAVTWLAILLAVVVACDIYAIPLWVAVGSTVAACALAATVGELVDTGVNNMNGNFDVKTIALDIEEAIDNDHLTVHYQPIFDITTDTPEIVEAEVLVRWDHPELGLLSPIEFNIWQASSRIKTLLTNYVLQSVVEQHAAWREQGIRCPLAVNLSVAMLDDQDFPEWLAALLKRYDVDHDLVCLELPGRQSSTLPRSAIEVMERLADAGFRIVFENFGCNTYSMAEVTMLPLAGLKIDAELVGGLVDNPRMRQFVGSIIQMSHDMDIPVCAACVETEESAALLKELGCDRAQGWLYGMPVPSVELAPLLNGSTG